MRNITDVDDKINARAARDFPDLPPNAAIRRVTEKSARRCAAAVSDLGSLEPSDHQLATDVYLRRPERQPARVCIAPT
ncbi:hypothetical protein VW29_18035, partial [Devosia limi DSM 17137]